MNKALRAPLDRELLKLSLAAQSMAGFVRCTHPTYLMGWCHEEICLRLDKFLDNVREQKSPRLMICMPPRSGKSELASRRFPAYAFGRDPDINIISASYSADLSSRINRDVQRIMDTETYKKIYSQTRLPDTKARGYVRNNDMFELVGRRGSYRSAGVGGGITGMGGDIMIIDDPFKDRAEADSPTIRQRVWDWYTSTFYTRLSRGGGILIIATRWHMDDLTGRLLEAAKNGGGDTWETVDYPAIATHDEPHRKTGEALHPERYPLEQLLRIKAAIGPRDWEALYQQHPTADSGTLFKPEYFRRFRITNGTYELLTPDGPQYWSAAQCLTYSTCDTAAETKSSSDYFVNCTWALTPTGDLLLLDVFRARVEGPDQPALMWRKYHEYKPILIGVEKKITGISLLQDLVRGGLPAIDLNPATDKYNRAVPAGARYKMGKIYHLAGAAWLADYEKELIEFPTGAHDDQVDCASYAVQLLAMDCFSTFFNRPASGAIII